MSKQTYWMTDGAGTKALMEGVEERDLWADTHGWTLSDPPVPGEQVCVRHDEHGGKGRMSADVVERMGVHGWHPSAPAEPVDPTKDPAPEPVAEPEPVVVETAEDEQTSPVEAAASTKSNNRRAARGTTEE